MSLRTCSWLLPQKLHRYGTLVPLPELVDIAPFPARWPVTAAPGWSAGALLRLVRIRALLGAPGPLLGGGRTRAHGWLVPLGVHLVDDAIRTGLLGGHEIVPVGVLGDLLLGLAGVVGEDPVEALVELL